MKFPRFFKNFFPSKSAKPIDPVAPLEESVYEEVEEVRRDDEYDYIDFLQDSARIRLVNPVQQCELQIRRSGELHEVHARIVDNQGRNKVFNDEAKICAFLRTSSVYKMIVRGILTNKICAIAGESARCDILRIEGAKVNCTSSWLTKLFNKTTTVEMENCEFENHEILCDEVFVENPQLININIKGICGKYSFPMVTDRVLRFWTQQRENYKVHLGAETSFTCEGIQYLTQMLHNGCRTSLYLGKFHDCIEEFQKLTMPRRFRLDSMGSRCFILNENKNSIHVTFDCSLSRMI